MSLFIAAVVLAAGVAGLYLCSPSALPGDEWWNFKRILAVSASTWMGASPPACFFGGHGETLLSAAVYGIPLSLSGVAAIGLWDLAWRPWRRWRMRAAEGGSLLFGQFDHVETMFRGETPVPQPSRIILSSLQDKTRMESRRPFTETAVAIAPGALAGQAKRLGADKAGLVAAISDSDLENIELAEAALAGAASRSPRRILLRIEHPVVRSLRLPSLVQQAEAAHADIVPLSLNLLQARAGLKAAMPGRYSPHPGSAYHAVICGSGRLLAQIAFWTARQGYGLERAVPALTLLRTGLDDFSPGALERLQSARSAVSITAAHLDAENLSSLERAITGVASLPAPLSAIHCVGKSAGEAVALALQWERILLLLHVPVPPIIVYGPEATPTGRSGMLRIVPRLGAGAGAQATFAADEMARILHGAYVARQRATKGTDFGAHPAETSWERLGEALKDDNRGFADHIEYKLARAGCWLAAAKGAGLEWREDTIRQLGEIEHARWMASKLVSGMRLGERRDDSAGHHPDIRPFGELSEEARAKDYDAVRAIPSMLRSAGMQPVALVRKPACGRSSNHPPGDPGIVWQCRLGDGPEVDAATGLLAAREAVEAIWDERTSEILLAGGEEGRKVAHVLSLSRYIRHERPG